MKGEVGFWMHDLLSFISALSAFSKQMRLQIKDDIFSFGIPFVLTLIETPSI